MLRDQPEFSVVPGPPPDPSGRGSACKPTKGIRQQVRPAPIRLGACRRGQSHAQTLPHRMIISAYPRPRCDAKLMDISISGRYGFAMVSISHEPTVTTERRLIGVLQQSTVTHVDGTWAFVRFDGPIPDGAVAAVNDVDGWCALIPAHDAALEQFCLTSVAFPAGVDNSGFVGWLAATIKQELGSGVFVVCGDNPLRGGIFDYWGYPSQIVDDVRSLFDRLCAKEPEPISLDLRVFRVIATAADSEISSETTFQFRERDGHIEASYHGGQIAAGRFLGRRTHDSSADVAYLQLHTDGRLKTGASTLKIERMGATGLRVTEEYQWTDGRRGTNVLESVEP